MKKLWFLLLIPVLGLGGLLIYQNLPEKRYARHITKARLYAKENNLTAAQLEYEAAYNTTGRFTPYASLEVLRLMNRRSLQDKNPEEALANSRMFVKEHPDNKQGRLILSHLAFQAGDPETAFESVNAVLESDPGHFPARILLTQVRTQQGRLDLAEAQLRFLYGKYPDSLRALLPLAENLLKQGKVAESRGFIAEMLADHPKNASLRLLLVDAYLAERKLDSAQAVLEAWQLEAPREMSRPIAIRRARFYALAGRFTVAESLFAPFLKPEEENVPVLAEAAVLKAAQGQYDSAIGIYASLGEAMPGFRAFYQRMTLMLHLKNLNPAQALETAKILQLGKKGTELLPFTLAAYHTLDQGARAMDLIAKQPDSLQAALKAMVSQWPADKEFIGQWALVEYFRLNNHDFWELNAGRDLYRKWPQNPLAVNLFANQLAAHSQYAGAAAILETQKNPSATQQSALLNLYARSGQRQKAVDLAEKLLRKNPGQRGLNVLIADHAMSKGNRARAIELYGKELDLNPANPVALNNLAWEYGIVQGDFGKALPYLEKLRAQNSTDPRILDTMGWILARNGKAAEGRKYIGEALNLAPDFPGYLFHMGWIHAQAGEKDAARKHIQSALDSKMPFEERKEAEALLAQQG